MSYRLLYNITPAYKMILRIILLVGAIAIDLSMIYFIISAIFVSENYWYAVVGCIIVANICRIISIELYQHIEYMTYNGKLVVKRLFVIYSRTVIDCALCDIKVAERLSHSEDRQYRGVDITDESSEKYYIELKSGEKYICNLDDYMYATILEGQNDILR